MNGRRREAGRFALARLLRARAERSARNVGAVLVYHGIARAEGNGALEMDAGVTPEAFAGQLEHLRSHYRVVPAAAILDAVSARTRGQPLPVAITFDDDLPSHVDEALPVLREAGVPATFFLCGASLRSAHTFWWEDLQRAIGERLVRPDALPYVSESDVAAALAEVPRAIHRLASTIERLDPPRRAEAAAALRIAVGPPAAESGIREQGVRSLVAAGCEIGFHTLRHDALIGLSDAALTRALQDGRDQLAAAAGRPLRLIAYPHGKADRRVAAAAQTAGFALGFTTTEAIVSPGTDPRLVPRISPAPTPGGLALHLARALANGVSRVRAPDDVTLSSFRPGDESEELSSMGDGAAFEWGCIDSPAPRQRLAFALRTESFLRPRLDQNSKGGPSTMP